MPLIKSIFSFSRIQKTLVEQKRAHPAFSHLEWGHDDLQDLRSKIREHYRNEQQGLCAYCKNPISQQSASNAHIEHIAPKSLYIDFIFEPKNLCVVCADCNEIKKNQEVMNEVPNTVAPLSKGNTRKKYPKASSSFLIIHPHFDDWDNHILKFGHQYTDRSPKGAFTIMACKLNRFFHKSFNVDDSFVDDEVLAMKMNAWMAAKSSIQKAQLLESLKRDMSMMI